MVRLGVGKNMVRSMRHWAIVTGVLAESTIPNNRGRVLEVTELGRRLLLDGGWDPYLEDPATVWLLHWRIASTSERATTWHWVFSHIPQPEFTKEELQRWLMKLIEQRGWKRITPASLKRDIDCFTRTYVPPRPSRTVSIDDTLDCPLAELGLLRETGTRGHYSLPRGERPTLPDGVFAFALAEYLERAALPTQTVGLESVAFTPGSPGRVFGLGEVALLERLERLERVTGGALAFDETAGLRQVLIRRLPATPLAGVSGVAEGS